MKTTKQFKTYEPVSNKIRIYFDEKTNSYIVTSSDSIKKDEVIENAPLIRINGNQTILGYVNLYDLNESPNCTIKYNDNKTGVSISATQDIPAAHILSISQKSFNELFGTNIPTRISSPYRIEATVEETVPSEPEEIQESDEEFMDKMRQLMGI